MVRLWQSKNWTKYIDYTYEYHRCGLRLRFEKNVDKEVRRACIEFCNWLRSQYYFPIRVVIYFKDSEFVLSEDKELVSAIFWGPYNKKLEPYIKISTGDFYKMEQGWGKDEALAAILCSIIHELSHYFQWIKADDETNESEDINLAKKEEMQVKYCVKKILREYADIREHP